MPNTLETIDGPVTYQTEEDLKPELTMKEFMTEQRAVIYSDLQQHRLTHAHSQAMIERLTDSLNLIDEWFIEQAAPVEPVEPD